MEKLFVIGSNCVMYDFIDKLIAFLGPVAVPLYVSNGVPPPISAPPGYMLHFAEEGGGKHVRILPLVAPAVLDHPNSYVGPSMPHPHQSSIQMPGMSPVQPLYYPNVSVLII